jgi:hypothetical protein
MARRTLNRRELRQQADQAAQLAEVAPGPTPAAVGPRKTARKAPAPKRKPRAKKVPLRMRVRWGLFDATMKQIAIFDYACRAEAEEKLADLLTKKKGLHFLQLVKEPMPEPVSAVVAAVE